MTILLIRHAESQSNADERLVDEIADHAMALTPRGQEQAAALGAFLKDWYHANPPQGKVRLWCSPYQRTLQTVKGMRVAMDDWTWDICGRGRDIHFDDRLREKDWGYYRVSEYKKGSRLEKEEPFLFAHYRRVRKAPMGRYFSRPLGGESMADVADRLRSFFHDLYFDIGRGVTDHLIVTHGAAMISFVYAFTKVHPIFADNEFAAANTSVRLLDIDPRTGRYADYGYIYEPDQNIYLTARPPFPFERDMGNVLG